MQINHQRQEKDSLLEPKVKDKETLIGYVGINLEKHWSGIDEIEINGIGYFAAEPTLILAVDKIGDDWMPAALLSEGPGVDEISHNGYRVLV